MWEKTHSVIPTLDLKMSMKGLRALVGIGASRAGLFELQCSFVKIPKIVRS